MKGETGEIAEGSSRTTSNPAHGDAIDEHEVKERDELNNPALRAINPPAVKTVHPAVLEEMIGARRDDLQGVGAADGAVELERATEAERAGLVSRIVALDKLMDETLGAALMICEHSQLATMAAKESVNRAFESGLSDGLMFERRLFQSMFATSDQKEGMGAFLDKRRARFAGT